MFLLRPAGPADLAAILELAGHLDSPNLPADEGFLAARLERAREAFAQPGPPHALREYQFALCDPDDRVVGTAVILSKHGTRDMPHLYLGVEEEERYSDSTGVAMRHVLLQLGATWDGPTELGALVLHPDARGRPGQAGRLLSWGRLAYIARHPEGFEDQLLAEMRAAIDEQGRSKFWDAFGGRFTGMSYAEADRRSATDKRFILDLFPRREFYASLLDAEVGAQLGEVHPETVPALRLLESAGLHWIGQIDPFDGGPFVGAHISEVVPIRETWQGQLEAGEPEPDAPLIIVSTEEGGGFRAVAVPASATNGGVRIPKDAHDRLGIAPLDELHCTPLPVRARRRAHA